VFVGVIIVLVMVLKRQQAKAKEKSLELTAKLSGVECEVGRVNACVTVTLVA